MKEFFALIAAIFFTLFFLVINYALLPLDLSNEYFRIARGESAYSVSQRLGSSKIIRSQRFLYYYIRLSNSAPKLKYGLYRFEGENSVFDVLNKIRTFDV